jgi:SHS2 domain-containing protein
MSNVQLWKRFTLLILSNSNWQDTLLGNWTLDIGTWKSGLSMPYQTIDHTADIGIAVQADSVETLFTEAARALAELIFGRRSFSATETVTLSVKGSDWPDLMVNWLRELLYLWNGENKILGPVAIRRLTPFIVEATVQVDNAPCDPHDIFNEIKAVTYHAIAVGQTKTDWQARIIFDI